MLLMLHKKGKVLSLTVFVRARKKLRARVYGAYENALLGK